MIGWIAAAGWLAAAFFGLMYRAELNRCMDAEDKLIRVSMQYFKSINEKRIK